MKICLDCKDNKPLSEYYKDKNVKSGYMSKCKQCRKKVMDIYRLNNITRIREHDRQRNKSPHRNKGHSERTKRYKSKHPLKYNAHYAVKSAIRSGELIRPKSCSSCESENIRIEGHHEDYNKLLDVIWLCQPCHMDLHKDKTYGNKK
jgi:hypothetical protein